MNKKKVEDQAAGVYVNDDVTRHRWHTQSSLRRENNLYSAQPMKEKNVIHENNLKTLKQSV